MSHSPAVRADGDPLDELVNNASKASAAAAKVPANVVGVAPAPVVMGPTAATLVDVMKLFGSPSVPTSIANAPVPAKAVVTFTRAFVMTKSVGVLPKATVTVSEEPLPSSMSVYLIVYLWVNPCARS